MRILSVTPSGTGGSTLIKAVQDGHFVDFVYSDIHELLYDPFKPHEWWGWNGGTLTEAISYVIALYLPKLSPKADL